MIYYFDLANNPVVATNGGYIIINCLEKNVYSSRVGGAYMSNQSSREFLIRSDVLFFYKMKYSEFRIL